MSEVFQVERITGFRFAARDPASASAFLRDALEAQPAGGNVLRLELGGTRLTVGAGPDGGAPAANDPAFQHLAVVVSDIAEAHRRVMAHGAVPISRGGPVRLPPANGGVTAWKFRMPDGQPLELLEAPTDAWRKQARATGRLVLGIDHTALGCPDPRTTIVALHRLGFRDGPASHNAGPEQDRLDGLDGVDLHVRTLFAPGAGPHIELLSYSAPVAPQPLIAAGVATLLECSGHLTQTALRIGRHTFELARNEIEDIAPN